MNNKDYKYLYIISSYAGDRGSVDQEVYKMNSNTEEMRNACKEDFKRSYSDGGGLYMHLCSEIVIEIKDIGIDAFVKDGDECYKKYQEEQKEVERQELAEFERLKKKYNK